MEQSASNHKTTVQIRNIQLAKDLLTLIMLHMTLACFIAIIFCTGEYYSFIKNNLMKYWYYYFPIPFYFYFVRRMINKISLFLLMHIIPVIAVIISLFNYRAINYMILLLIVLIGYMIHSFYLKLTKPDSVEMPAISLVQSSVTALICVTISTIMGMKDYYIYFFISAIICIGVFFIANYLETYIRFITINESSASRIPKRSIFESGLRSTALFALGGVIISSVIVMKDRFEKLLTLIRNVLFNIMKWLVSLIPESGIEIDDSRVESVPMERPEFLNGLVEDQEPSKFLQILDIIVRYILWAVFIAVICYILFTSIRKLIELIRNAFKNERMETIKEISEGDIRERCTIERIRTNRDTKFQLFPSNELKIRRLFQRRVLHSQLGVASADTTHLCFLSSGQCAECFDNPEAIRLYDKARYSNSNCTQDDVKCMREYSN